MFHFDNVNALRNARDKCRVAIRPASGRTVRFFKALSGVRRSIKPDAYLSSFTPPPVIGPWCITTTRSHPNSYPPASV